MRTWQAFLIAATLFVGGALSAWVVGLVLAESWIVFSVYMVAGLLSAILFFGAYYFRRHTLKWVLAGLIVAVGFLGLLWHGGGKAIGAFSGTSFFGNGYDTREQPLGLAPEEVVALEGDYTVTIINAGNGSLTFSVGPLPMEMGAAIACQAGLSHETVQTHSYVEGTSLLDWDLLVEDSGHAPGEGWLNRDNGTWYCSYLDLRFERGGGDGPEFAPQGDEGPPETVIVDDFPWICDDELFGRTLFDPDAEMLVIDIPAGYDFVQVTSDSAIANGVSTNGKGFLALSNVTLEIVTRNGNVNGVGWNDENLRWNVHGCAVPPQLDVVQEFLDWQFAQISGEEDRSGDHKPSGYLFLEEETIILWENVNFRNQAADNPTVEELWQLILESLPAE